MARHGPRGVRTVKREETGRPAAAPRLATVAVDLTPLLPGGANGGARRFVEVLVTELARLLPGTRFLLLTQASSHDTLAFLDAPNVERCLVLPGSAERARGGLFASGSRLLPLMPRPVRRMAATLAYRLNRSMKRRGARAALEQSRLDLLFCPFTAPTLQQPGVPTVCTLYDLQYREHPEFFTPEDAAMRAAAVREACAGASAIAAISDHARGAAIRLEHARPERIRTIPLRLAGSAPSARLPRTPVTPGRYFVYPANFWPHKNHARLLEAFSAAREHGLEPDYCLVLTGTGPCEAAVRQQAKRLGLEDRVTVTGYVEDAEVAALIAHARGLVFPSLYEGFGLPVIEAMALGTPVACAKVAALPETAGGAALLFDPANVADVTRVLLELAGDGPSRERLVASGRERAREFQDASRMAREYHALFEETLARG